MLYSRLSINALHLHVRLGWPEKERLEKQTISLDVEIQYHTPPKACASDQLQDTICYSDLIKTLKNHLENKTYHLIEYLSHDAYQLLKQVCSPHDRVKITVLKHPNVVDLSGGVTFSYGDPLE